MRSSQIRNTLLASGAAVALAATAGSAAADDLSTLRDQLQKLQSKVAKIEADRTATSRRVAAAAAVEAGDRPRSWKLPGTNTSMVIGGYVKLDILWSPNQKSVLGSTSSGTVANKGGVPAQNGGNFDFHAKQSRFFVRTWTPTDWGELTTLLEIDFYNTTGGGNSPRPRLRHAWGCLGPVCAGQTWTLFMPIWSYPEVLDFGGPLSSVFARKAQVRFTHSFGGGWVFSASIEDPGTVGPALVTGNGGGDRLILPGGVGNNQVAGVTAQDIPEFVLALAYGFRGSGALTRGRVGIQATVGKLEGDAVGAKDAFKWAIGAAGAFAFGRRFRFGVNGWIGRGYNSAGFGGNQAFSGDAFVVGTSLKTFLHYSGMVWVRYAWTDTLRSTVAYAYFGNKHQSAAAKATFAAGLQDWAQSIHANLIWSPVPAVNIGIEYTWLYVGRYNGANGEAHQVQISFQYKF